MSRLPVPPECEKFYASYVKDPLKVSVGLGRATRIRYDWVVRKFLLWLHDEDQPVSAVLTDLKAWENAAGLYLAPFTTKRGALTDTGRAYKLALLDCARRTQLLSGRPPKSGAARTPVPEECAEHYARYETALRNSSLRERTCDTYDGQVRKFLQWLHHQWLHDEGAPVVDVVTDPLAWFTATENYLEPYVGPAGELTATGMSAKYAFADAAKRLGLHTSTVSAVPDHLKDIDVAYRNHLTHSTLAAVTVAGNIEAVEAFLRWHDKSGRQEDVRTSWDAATDAYLTDLVQRGRTHATARKVRSALNDCGSRLGYPVTLGPSFLASVGIRPDERIVEVYARAQWRYYLVCSATGTERVVRARKNSTLPLTGAEPANVGPALAAAVALDLFSSTSKAAAATVNGSEVVLVLDGETAHLVGRGALPFGPVRVAAADAVSAWVQRVNVAASHQCASAGTR
jgi:hypothetical protein